MKQLTTLYLALLFTFQHLNAQSVSSFVKFLDSGESIEVIAVQEIVAHFSTGEFKDGESDEEERVMITYFREKGVAHKLSANEVQSLTSLADDTYDASNDPMSGWFGSVVIRVTPQKKNSQYWMVTLMRAGPLSFRPVKTLHQDKNDLQLYQYDLSEKAYDAGFCSRSSEWEKRFLKILNLTKQRVIEKSATAE